MTSVLTLTMNPAVDLSTSVPKVQPYHKLRCTPAEQHAGGGGVNVARALTRLGTPCRAVMPAGGVTGAQLQQMLATEGVACTILPIAGDTRESFTVHEADTGEEFRFVLPGPTLSEGEWRGCLDWLTQHTPRSSCVVASGSLPPGVPPDFLARLAHVARAKEAQLVVDASGAALHAALQAGVHLIKPSLSELQALTGSPLTEEQDRLHAAQDLIARGQTRIVALTQGQDGALLVSAEGAWRAAAPEVPVRSTVGAGDSFLAGLLWGLQDGQALPDAFASAMAAAAAALLMPGTTLCQPADVLRLRPQVRVQALALPSRR